MSAISTAIRLGDIDLGNIKIWREGTLGRRGRDIQDYRATFQTPEWREGAESSEVAFRHRFSYGALSLQAAAVRALILAYPELRAGRYGAPRNRARCRHCGSTMWSRERHEYVVCRCGKTAVDGGYAYCHTMGKPVFLKESWQTGKKKRNKGTT